MYPIKDIHVIEFPSNLGLKEPYPGKEPGVRHLPSWLKKQGLYDQLSVAATTRLDPPAYTMNIDAESGVRNADALVNYAIAQNKLLSREMDEKLFPLIIGGDCSILLGPLLTLRQQGDYALFYLDGHTDFMWPALSETAGAGGMVAAFAAGRGPEKLTNILNLRPYIPEEQVWCVGNREYIDWYEAAIKESKATYVSLSKLRKRGINECVQLFMKQVYAKNLDGFWIHFDVDVLNDEIMPAVDSRTPDGLQYEELREILIPLLSDPKVAGLTLTILDPDLDPEGFYTKKFVDEIGKLFKKLT